MPFDSNKRQFVPLTLFIGDNSMYKYRDKPFDKIVAAELIIELFNGKKILNFKLLERKLSKSMRKEGEILQVSESMENLILINSRHLLPLML